ncbi:MAG: PAS domain S-box protein, partial [Oligoflexales bacterium]|nr:PAS domain S-box protein [Oligoflexales bacterium]
GLSGYFCGGFDAPSFILIGVIPVIVILCTGSIPVGVLWSILAFMEIVLFFVLDRIGYAFPQELADRDRELFSLFFRLGNVWIFFIGAWIYETQRLRTLEQEDLFFNNIMTSLNDMLFVFDLNRTVIYVNHAVTRQLGYSHDEIVGRKIDSIFDDKEAALATEAEFPTKVEKEFIRKNGSVIHLDLSYSKISESRKEKSRVICVARDITDQKRIAGEKMKSEKQFRLIFENSKDAIFWIVPDTGMIVNCNVAAERLLERTREEIIGESEKSLLHYTADIDRAKEGEPEAGRGKSDEFETIVITRSESVKHVEVSSFMVDIDGELISQKIYKDISDRKYMETEKDRMQEELFQSKKMSTVGTLSEGVSHELLNPLTIIYGFADMIKKCADNPEFVREKVDVIIKNSLRMKAIVEHMRRFCNISQIRGRKDIDIRDPVRVSLDLLEELLKEREISRKIYFEENSPMIWGNSSDFEIIIQNLILNSIDSFDCMKDDRSRRISISTLKIEDGVKIMYEDNAAGMTEDVKERMYDPFFTTKGVGKGVGFGMTLIFGIISAYNGTISCTSIPGEGTVFEILFPVKQRKAA